MSFIVDDLTGEQIIQWVCDELSDRMRARFQYNYVGRTSFVLYHPGSGQPPQLAISVAGNPYGKMFELSNPDLIEDIFEWITGKPYRPLGMKDK